MTPIYDANVQQVAWFDGENLFDLGLNWIAFHSSGHIFSSSNLRWLGPLNDGSFQDRSGPHCAMYRCELPRGTAFLAALFHTVGI